MGILANSLSNYLWNGYSFVEAVNSTGEKPYPFSLYLSGFGPAPYTRMTASLRTMDTSKPTKPTASSDIIAKASGTSGVPLFVGGTPVSSFSNAYINVTANGSNLSNCNLVIKYPSSVQTLVYTAKRSAVSTTSTNTGCVWVGFSASTSEETCKLSASFEKAGSSVGSWTASGTWREVTPSGVTASHTYIPWATYYSGFDYGISESASAVYTKSGSSYHYIVDENNLWYDHGTSRSGSSNSAMDLRLGQGFIIPTAKGGGTYTLSADFTSPAGKTHTFCTRVPGTWYYFIGGASIYRFQDGVTYYNSSTPSAATTASGVIGEVSGFSAITTANIPMPIRTFVSSNATGEGTWTASGTSMGDPYLSYLGVKVIAV